MTIASGDISWLIKFHKSGLRSHDTGIDGVGLPNWQRNGSEALQLCVLNATRPVLTSVDRITQSRSSVPDGSPDDQCSERVSDPEMSNHKPETTVVKCKLFVLYYK